MNKYNIGYIQLRNAKRMVWIQRIVIGTILLAIVGYCVHGFNNRLVVDSSTIDYTLIDHETLDLPVQATLTPNTYINDNTDVSQIIFSI